MPCQKAAVAWGPGEALVMEVVEVDPPQPLEIRIKVIATSLCGSDVSAWRQSQVNYALFNGGKIVFQSARK